MEDTVLIFEEINIAPLLKEKEAFERALKDTLQVRKEEGESDKFGIFRDATIRRFNFTFELSWRTTKRILGYGQSSVPHLPIDVIRHAAKNEIIDNPTAWFNFLKMKNQIPEGYKEEVAHQIFSQLPLFQKELDKLIEKILALN